MSFDELERCVRANLESSDNQQRNQAESYLKELRKKQPNEYLTGLTQLVSKSSNPSVRSFSYVLMRQCLGILDNYFEKLPKEMQTSICNILLQQIQNETQQNVLTQICEAIGALAAKKLQAGQWPELMPCLVHLSKSNLDRHRMAYLQVLDKLAEFSIDLLRNNLQTIHEMLANGLQDKSENVRCYALKCVVSVLINMNESSDLQTFVDLLPLLFQNIQASMGDSVISKACEYLQTLIETRSEYFRDSMQPILACLSQVVHSQQLQWESRRLAMNLLMTLLEYHSDSIDIENLAKDLVPLPFVFLRAFDGEITFDSPADYDDQRNFQFGGDSLSRIIPIVGANSFLSIAQPIFDKGFADISNANWIDRLIALAAVENACESCAAAWESQLESIVNATGQSLQHSQPFIQFAALRVINKLSVVFAEDGFVTNYDDCIVNSLLSMLTKHSELQRCVLIQVCDSIAHYIYFDEDCEITMKYAEKLLQNLYEILKLNDAQVRCSAFKAVSVLISVMTENFIQYYDTFMKLCQDLLQSIFSNNCQDSTGLLRGRAMECMAQMISALPIDKCGRDAHTLMKVLLPLLSKSKQNESYSYMVRLFVTIAECLKSEFQPYLSACIQPLIKAAKLKSVKIRSAAEAPTPLICQATQKKEQEAMLQNYNSSEMQSNGEKKTIITHSFAGIEFVVNTAETNEKKLAVETFIRYCCALEADFLPFVQPVCSVLIPMLRQRIQSSLRASAVDTMAPLLNCLKAGLAKKNIPQNDIDQCVQALLTQIFPALVDAMNVVEDVEDLSGICIAIQELIVHLREDNNKCREIISDITEQLNNAMQERQMRMEQSDAGDSEMAEYGIDEDVIEQAEAELADNIVDVVASLAKQFTGNYVPIFDEHCSNICAQFLDDQSTVGDKILSLSMLTEVIRYGGDNAKKYIQSVLQKCAHFVQQFSQKEEDIDINSDLVQSACYAIGICAERKSLNDIQNWLQLLQVIINSNDSKSDDNITATENAIAAVAKICKNYIQAKPSEQQISIILTWIQMLPIVNDHDEREFCNDYLLQLLQSNVDGLNINHILKNNSVSVAKIIEIVAVAMQNDDKQKVQFEQLFQMLCNANQNGVQLAIQKLSTDLQKVFQK